MHNVVTRLSGTPGSIRRRAPEIGEDTEAILRELRVSRKPGRRPHG